MNKREFMRVGAGTLGFVAVAGFGPPACDGVSKDKAVRYTGIAIDYLTDMLPILSQIGGAQVATLINKALPVLEKLKKTLEDADFPTAGNLFETVGQVLGQVATALMQLPESAKRNTIMGILTLVQITLRTVSLFIESETPPTTLARVPRGVRLVGEADAVRKAFEATRF